MAPGTTRARGNSTEGRHMASKTHFRQAALVGVAGIALMAGSATASAQSQAAAGNDIEEVVVTGTMIRGVAPVGSNVIGLSHEDIEASGARSTQDILATMPQASNFNNLA